MSKSISNTPQTEADVLAAFSAPQPKQGSSPVAGKTKTKAQTEQDVFDAFAKKKAGGEDSSTPAPGGSQNTIPSPSPSPSPSVSHAQQPEQPVSPDEQTALQDQWNNHTIDSAGIARLAKTDFGIRQGLQYLTKDGYAEYARVHTRGSQSDLFNKVGSVVQATRDLVYQMPTNGIPSAFDIDMQKVNAARAKDLVGMVMKGDIASIRQYRDSVVGNLQNNIEVIQERNRNGADGRISADKIKQLKDQIDQVNETFNQWASQNIVSQNQKQPGGIYSSENQIKIGRSIRSLSLTQRQDELPEHIHDPTAITERNYIDQQAGLRAVINSMYRDYAGAYKDMVKSGGADAQQHSVNLYGGDLDGLISDYRDLDNTYFPVRMFNVGRVIQDQISKDHPVFNFYISDSDIDRAVYELDKKSPGFKEKNADVISEITRREHVGPFQSGYLANQGFLGNLGQSGFGALKDIGAFVPDITGTRTAEDRTADEIKEGFEPSSLGTAQSGLSRTKLVVTPDGNHFIEEPNEAATKFFDFNSFVAGAGQFAGNMAVYALLTEGIGNLAKAGGEMALKPFGATLVNSTETKETAGLIGSTYLMNYDRNLTMVDQEIPGNSNHDHWAKGMAANMLTLGQAAAMKILPPNVLVRESFMKGLAKDAVAFLKNYDVTKGLSGIDENFMHAWLGKTKEVALKYVNQTSKGWAETVIQNHANQIINESFGGKHKDLFEDDLKAITGVTAGILVMSLPGLIPESVGSLQRDALYDVALNPDEHIEHVNDLVEKGQMDREQGNGIIKLIKTAKKNIAQAFFGENADGTPYTKMQTKRALADMVSRDVLTDKLKQNPDDTRLASLLKTVNGRLKDLPKETPYKNLNNSETLNAIGVKDVRDIDPEKEYQFELKNKPKGFSDDQVSEKKDDQGDVTGYDIKATGMDVLLHLPYSEINEKENNATEAKGGEDTDKEGRLEGGQKTETENDIKNEKINPGDVSGQERGRQETPQASETRGPDQKEHQGEVPAISDEKSVISPEKVSAEQAEPSFEEEANEAKENYQHSIRMLERKEDRITSNDLTHPDQVKEDVLQNIAAKETEKEPLTESEKDIARARRADIDQIKIDGRGKRNNRKLSDEDQNRAADIRKNIRLIDKFGIDDIVNKLKDAKLLEIKC